MTAEDLNLILEIGLEISETDIKPYLFLDEIQNINEWGGRGTGGETDHGAMEMAVLTGYDFWKAGTEVP